MGITLPDCLRHRLTLIPTTFRHIWIDSLCIIQDSPKGHDWHVEAPKMTTVYGNSFLNIAAANARNSTEGLFRRRDAHALPPSVTSADWDDPDMDYKVVREDFWKGEVLSEPLYSRAWVFQGWFPHPVGL